MGLLRKIWNRLQGLEEKDFENCEKLARMTGLAWRPHRADASSYAGGDMYTRYITFLPSRKEAEALADVLYKLIPTKRTERTYERAFQAHGMLVAIPKYAFENQPCGSDTLDLESIKKEINVVLEKAGLEEKKAKSQTLAASIR